MAAPPPPVLPKPVLPAPALPAPSLPAPALPAPVLPAPVLPAPALPAPTASSSSAAAAAAAPAAAAAAAPGAPERSSSVLTFSTRLHQAARDGDLAAVQACAEAGDDLDAHEPVHGWTALHIAAENARVDVLRYLIDQEVDINARDNDDETPMHCAAFWGHTEIVGWLLANGAMLEAHNKYQWTPYDLAVRRGKDEVAELLLDEQRFKTLNGLP